MNEEEHEALHEEVHEKLGWASHISETAAIALRDAEEGSLGGEPLAVLFVFPGGTAQMNSATLTLEERAAMTLRLVEITEENLDTLEEHRLINSALN